MPTVPALLSAALATYAEAEAAMKDAAAAMVDVPKYIRDAITSRHAIPADRERIGKVALYLPTSGDIMPASVHPHEAYGDAALCYTIGGDPFRWDAVAADVGDWRATVRTLLERHPPIPVSVARGSCTSIRPDERPGRHEDGAKIQPVAPVIVTADKVSDYPHKLLIQWWTSPAPGVVLRIEVTGQGHNDLTRRVSYRVTNAPKNDYHRQHPEDRKWEVSSTWGPGSTRINWWTSPGNPPRVTWTWPVGTTFDDMTDEVK